MTSDASDADPLVHRSELPTLTTARLVIRPLRPGDAPAIFEIFSDRDVTRYWGHGQMHTLDEAETFIQETVDGFQNRMLLEWGLTLRGSDVVIGTCAFAAWDPQHRRAEIGFALRRDHWGRGLMSEALPALLHYGFDSLRLRRIEADVDPRNAASIQVLEKMGFRREGYLRERYRVDGEVQDAIIYGLLRRDAKTGS